MTDYTPGPWRVATKGPGLLGIYADASASDLIAGIASADNQEANARLMAAAPDLLAALEVALNDFDTWGEVWQSDDDDGVNFPAVNAIRAAIAKARGE